MEERNALLAEVTAHLSICLNLCTCIDPVLSFVLVIPAKMPHLLAGGVLYVWVYGAPFVSKMVKRSFDS